MKTMQFFTLFKRNAFLYAFLFLLPLASLCQTNTWAGGNANWNTAGNWSLGVVPTAAHDVVINTSSTITVNVTTTTINTLTISGSASAILLCGAQDATITMDNSGSAIALGSSLTLQGANGSGTRSMGLAFTGSTQLMTVAGTLNLTNVGEGTIYNATNSNTVVNGTINNTGTTLISTTANLSFSSGGTYIHAINGSNIPLATWNAAANCNVTGITNTVPGNLNQSFGNFTWNCGGHSATINLAGNLTTINGNFTINQAGNPSGGRVSDPLVLTQNTNTTLNVGGNFTLSNLGVAAWFALTNGTAAVTMNVTGNFSMSNATTFFDCNISSSQNSALIINVGGNYTQTDGFFDWCFTPTTGTVASEMRIGGNFSHSGAALMSTSIANTASTVPNGKLVFNRVGTQTVSVATPTNIGFTNYDVNSGSTTELLSALYMYSSATARWGGNFTVKNGGILDAGTFQIQSITPAGTNNAFILESGAGIITANVNGVQNALIGTIYNAIATRTFSSGANYSYDGTAIQNSGTFTTSPTANQVNNLTVNNTAGNTTSGVTLQQTFAVATTLTLTSGHITSTATNLLIMNAGSNVAGANYATRISGGSDNSFVNGPIRKVGNTDFLFPVGKINAGHHYCGISAPANPGDTYTAEYIRNSAYTVGTTLVSGLDHISRCEYWTINTTAASPNVNVTLSWNGSSNCSAAIYVNDLATLVVAHFGTTSWDSFGNNGGNTGIVSDGSVTWNNVTTFSPFTLGSTSATTNPLPVKFVNVKAYPAGDNNKIEWANLTEAEVESYEVERSIDGISFTAMSIVEARGNAGTREEYNQLDNNTAFPTIWYRIKAKELSGAISYSPIVKVSRGDKDDTKLVLYPNPVVAKQVTVQLYSNRAENYTIRIFNNVGQMVHSANWQHSGGSSSRTIELPANIAAGVYYLKMSGGTKDLNSRFTVQ